MIDLDAKRETIAARLKLAIFHSALTRKEIAQQAGVSDSSLEKYTHNRVMPTAEKLAALCGVMRVNPAWVLGLSDRREL